MARAVGLGAMLIALVAGRFIKKELVDTSEWSSSRPRIHRFYVQALIIITIAGLGSLLLWELLLSLLGDVTAAQVVCFAIFTVPVVVSFWATRRLFNAAN